MNKISPKVLSLLIMTIFLLTSGSIVYGDNSGENNGNNTINQCSVEENKELEQFTGELKIAQQNLWDAKGEKRWLKKSIKNATGSEKVDLQNELAIAQQKLWDAEGEIDWLKDQIKKLKKDIKKLNKDCDDNYGYGQEHGNEDGGNAWWKNWKNWFSGSANAFWNR